MKRNRRLLASGTALVLAVCLGVAGVGSSAAYFSDTVTGGMIVISEPLPNLIGIDTLCNSSPTGVTCSYPEGTDGKTHAPVIDFNDSDQVVSQSITVVNTGEASADVYLQFGPDLEAFNTELAEGAKLQIKVNDKVVASYGQVPLGYNELTSTPVLLAEDLPEHGQIKVTFVYTPDDSLGFETVEAPYRIYANDESGATVDSHDGGRIIVDKA